MQSKKVSRIGRDPITIKSVRSDPKLQRRKRGSIFYKHNDVTELGKNQGPKDKGGVCMVAVWVIVVLLIALIVLVALAEKFGPRASGYELAKYSRWILPLIALLLVMQLIAHLVR